MSTLSRRELLTRGAALGGAVAAGGVLAACGGGGAPPRGPRVVVVGAGLAGLVCARRLSAAGLRVTVIEAQQRIGGRCWSTRRIAPGVVGEHGGELIDTGHARIRALAAELDVPLTDLLAADAEAGGEREVLELGGRRRRRALVAAGAAPALARLEAEAERIGSYRWDRAGAAAQAFDERSAADWIAANVDGGARSAPGRLMTVDLTGAFGLDPQDLSAIALLQLYTGPDAGPEERFRVRGGADQLPRRLAAQLDERALRVGTALAALRRRPDGRYDVVPDRYRRPLLADAVVLALPLPALREVDLGAAGIAPRTRRMIDELGMGTNAKLLLGLDRRTPAFADWSGELSSDEPVLQTWDTALGQPGEQGLLTVFTGGRAGRELPGGAAHAEAPAGLVADVLERLEPVAPGITAAYTGRAWLDAWARDRWTGGSYAAFGPGQVTRFWGLGARPSGRVVFAGEHTSTRAQGYLEGAVESGERAARQVGALLGVS
ncbi:MAG: FAD-dependent oxidoreductase [Solirubrobacteraceae bacterium]|jgi:monoamine oxidase|nr:FAD-dependent oxidoreductase [Solirubrobacteraceae bacterium]